MIYELAALGAAACWAVTGLIAVKPVQHLGAIGFNRLRMATVFVMLAAAATAFGGWRDVASDQLAAIVISGFVGIFLGDTALFLALNRLGPRRTGILFAMNAPMSLALGWLLLGETLSLAQTFGALLAIAGVVLAVAYGKRRTQLHQWERVKGPLWIGVSIGLAAALCQSVGALVARPVMEAGADAVAVSAIRVGVAALGLMLLMQSRAPAFRQLKPLSWRIGVWTAFSGFLGMGVGMTLLLFALSGGDVGLVSTLSATTPAIILPLIWIRTGERPALGAFVGAALVVAGGALIFSE